MRELAEYAQLMRHVCAVAILLVLFVASCGRPEPKVSQSDLEKTHAEVEEKFVELNGWHISAETDRMDNTPTVYLSKLAENGQRGVLTIRCIRGQDRIGRGN